jgi:hypothetical protein
MYSKHTVFISVKQERRFTGITPAVAGLASYIATTKEGVEDEADKLLETFL